MMVSAIVNVLKTTSSITNVVPKGDIANIGNGVHPYVLVYEAPVYGLGRYEIDNTVLSIVIRVCFPKGYQDDLDNYVLFELQSLLHNKLIDVVNGTVETKVQTYCSSSITGVELAQDGYIYRERVIHVPTRWR